MRRLKVLPSTVVSCPKASRSPTRVWTLYATMASLYAGGAFQTTCSRTRRCDAEDDAGTAGDAVVWARALLRAHAGYVHTASRTEAARCPAGMITGLNGASWVCARHDTWQKCEEESRVRGLCAKIHGRSVRGGG